MEHNQTLELFKCPRCGHLQDFVCPGFGRHTPSKTLIRSGDSVQCIQCGQLVIEITCSCGRVTALTPDTLDDPKANNYVTGKQLAEYMSRFLEIGKRLMPAMMRLKNVWADETLVTELQTILAEWESLLASLPEKYPPINPDIVRTRIADIKSQITKRHRSEHQQVQRARMILAAAQGNSNAHIARELKINVDTVRLWRERWVG